MRRAWRARDDSGGRARRSGVPRTDERTTPVRALLSTGQRDRSRVALTVMTGALAAVTVAGTGVATAAAAQETARDNALKAQRRAAAEAAAAKAHHDALVKWAKENPKVVTKKRPTKTVIGPSTLVKASASDAELMVVFQHVSHPGRGTGAHRLAPAICRIPAHRHRRSRAGGPGQR